jgi:ubiquinol-cytochrome c reductase cytochrome c subunit
MRPLRRFLVPFAVLVIAAALGTFVIGREQIAASSPTMQNPGMKLDSTSQTTQSQIEAGRTLFIQTCSACHGVEAEGSAPGTPFTAPSLRGVGGAAVDLWLTAGWMPLRTPEVQPEAKPVYLTPAQIADIVAYVVSLAPGGVPVPPSVPLSGASPAEGFFLFSLNCAPCHTITGSGDALASGVHAPSLHTATAVEVLEAIRTGPQNMPRFGSGAISNQQALDVVDYVTKYIEHPRNIGGIGLGGVGPVAEGFVGLFVGVGACLLAAYWVGDRTARDEEDGHDDGEEGDGRGDEGDGHAEGGDAQGATAETEATIGDV